MPSGVVWIFSESRRSRDKGKAQWTKRDDRSSSASREDSPHDRSSSSPRSTQHHQCACCRSDRYSAGLARSRDRSRVVAVSTCIDAITDCCQSRRQADHRLLQCEPGFDESSCGALGAGRRETENDCGVGDMLELGPNAPTCTKTSADFWRVMVSID